MDISFWWVRDFYEPGLILTDCWARYERNGEVGEVVRLKVIVFVPFFWFSWCYSLSQFSLEIISTGAPLIVQWKCGFAIDIVHFLMIKRMIKFP